MSYSRRQLYAMGEPLGEGATRREVGGKIIYGTGGDGGQPEKQTTIVDIPDWAKPYAKESLGKASALTSTPYQAYGGERIAQFSPLQKQAFGQAGQQQVAGQIGTGTGLASLAGASSFNDPGTASSFMSPYMDAVVQQQMESAQRQADIASTQRGAQAVRAGAFGGSRQAIENAEAARALASQKGQIQATGLQSAFERGQSQFNQEQATRLNAAGQLGQLGQQQFGQQMDITGQQAQFGGQQRAATQDVLGAQYQDFLNQQRAPYDQLSFMSGIIRGTPMGQTTTMYAPPPSQTSQLIGLGTAAAGAYGAYKGAAAGGEVKGYAAGGIANLKNQPEMAAAARGMDDQQVAKTAGMAGIAGLTAGDEQRRRNELRMAAEGQKAPASMTKITSVLSQMSDAELQQYAKMHKSDPYTMALVVSEANRRKEGGMPSQQQPKVVDQQIAGMALPEEQGIAQLPMGNMEFAGGGIIAFAEGDLVPDPYDNRLRRGPAVSGITGLPPAPPPRMEEEEEVPPMPAAPNYSGIMGLYGKERDRQLASQEQLGLMRAADVAAKRADLAEEEKRATEFGAEREKRNKAQEEKLAGSEKQNFNMTLIDMGLAMMAGQSPNALQNLAAGAQQGLKGYQGRLQNIQDSREKLDESMARLAEIREEKLSAVGARKRELNSMERQALTNSKEAQEQIYSSFADKEITLTKEQAKAASDRALAIWSAKQKGAAGSRTDANNLRLALSTEIKALRSQRDSGNSFSEAEAQQLAQLESEFRSLTNILGERLGVQGSGTVAGSSTLPAGFKLD